MRLPSSTSAGVAPGGVGREEAAPARGWMPSGGCAVAVAALVAAGGAGLVVGGGLACDACGRGTAECAPPDPPVRILGNIECAVGAHRQPGRSVRGRTRLF